MAEGNSKEKSDESSSSQNSRRQSTRISVQCSICQDTEESNEMEYLPCSHSFHSVCLAKWLRRGRGCPICRTLVFGDVQAEADDVGDVNFTRSLERIIRNQLERVIRNQLEAMDPRSIEVEDRMRRFLSRNMLESAHNAEDNDEQGERGEEEENSDE